jgi:hypothetical protein
MEPIPNPIHEIAKRLADDGHEMTENEITSLLVDLIVELLPESAELPYAVAEILKG